MRIRLDHGDAEANCIQRFISHIWFFTSIVRNVNIFQDMYHVWNDDVHYFQIYLSLGSKLFDRKDFDIEKFRPTQFHEGKSKVFTPANLQPA